MDWKKNSIVLSLCLAIACFILIACKVEYSFNGASINYNEVKSISLNKFPIRCAYVWAPMEGMFYNSLSDAYAKKTKLKVLKKNGDLQLTGEITEYSQTNGFKFLLTH